MNTINSSSKESAEHLPPSQSWALSQRLHIYLPLFWVLPSLSGHQNFVPAFMEPVRDPMNINPPFSINQQQKPWEPLV